MYTHYRERTGNIPFIGWMGQRHVTTLPNSCPSKLNGEIIPRELQNSVESITYHNENPDLLS